MSDAGDAREVFLRHHASILRLSVLLAGGQHLGEELAQETFARCLTRVTQLPIDEQYPYLRAAASNLWKNRIRRMALERRWAQHASRSAPSMPVEDRDELWRAVVGLPVRQRSCVVLRYYEDLSERETADVLGCSLGNVKSQTSRAIARLRKEIGHEDRG